MIFCIYSKLRHANILLFLGACLSPKICIVTELMPRGNLRDFLRAEKPNWIRKLNAAIEITRGLQYLHVQNPPVLHRDLKSLNILVDETYHIKLADFGATSSVSAGTDAILEPTTVGGEPSSSSTASTAEQNYGGTLYCMAPEVLDHKPYTAASDVYSLGLVFWELATEKIPFDGFARMRLLRAIEEGELPALDAASGACSPEYAALVKKCISKAPEERPSLDDVMNVLKACKGAQT